MLDYWIEGVLESCTQQLQCPNNPLTQEQETSSSTTKSERTLFGGFLWLGYIIRKN